MTTKEQQEQYSTPEAKEIFLGLSALLCASGNGQTEDYDFIDGEW